MKQTIDLYEPVVSFKEQRAQMQINAAQHEALYEQAFLSVEDNCRTEYAQNTTTWD